MHHSLQEKTVILIVIFLIVAAPGLLGIDGKDRSNDSTITTTNRSRWVRIFHGSYQRLEGALLPSLVIEKMSKQKSTVNRSTTFLNFYC